MDQAESSSSPGRPEQGQPAPTPSQEPEGVAAEAGPEASTDVPDPTPLAALASSALRLEHPVIAGFDGSESSRNALAYAAGVSQRLGRPLLIVYVCSTGVYCEPLTGQVVGVPRDTEALERWLLAAAAEEFSADALVIGAPKHIWHRVAGGVSGWLARHARCPVIVVP